MDTPPQRSKERCTLRYSMSKSYNPSSEELWGMIHLLAERADNFLPSYENDLSLHTLQFNFFLQQWLQVANLTGSELVDGSALHIVRQFRKVVLCHRLAFLHKNIYYFFSYFLANISKPLFRGLVPPHLVDRLAQSNIEPRSISDAIRQADSRYPVISSHFYQTD